MTADSLLIAVILFVLIAAAVCITVVLLRKKRSNNIPPPTVMPYAPVSPPPRPIQPPVPKLDAESMYVFLLDGKKKVCRMCECENVEAALCCEVCGTTL